MTTSSTKPLVIYHANCSDGLTAAWCFYRQYGTDYEYFAGSYGDPVPDVYDRDVYLVDFSYKRQTIKDIAVFAKSITLIDHHKTALDDLWDLPASLPNFSLANSSTGYSGAMLAWQFVKEKEKHKRVTPQLLLHIQDRDLWKFELPNTAKLMFAVFNRDFDIKVYDKLMRASKRQIERLVEEGSILEQKFNSDVSAIIGQCRREIRFESEVIPLINANGMYASEVGNRASVGYPFAMVYFDTKSKRKFSLRSQKGATDVSEIAMRYGGGGHANAAGFEVDRVHFLARL